MKEIPTAREFMKKEISVNENARNIHILPTDKPSRLWTNNLRRRLELDEFPSQHPTNIAKNNYITSDEEIAVGDWCYSTKNKLVKKCINPIPELEKELGFKKIILTTDLDLIKDGVQAIDDEFLEWFVKNPSCERVEVKEKQHFEADKSKRINPLNGVYYSYKIIIPKEEPKQETLEEVARIYAEINQYNLEYYDEGGYQGIDTKSFTKILVDFTNKWQQEQNKNKYSEEEVENIIQKLMDDVHRGDICYGDIVIDFKLSPRQWFKQFKKK